MKTHIVQQTKYQLGRNIIKHVKFLNAKNGMGPLNDENKLQVDGNNNKKRKN